MFRTANFKAAGRRLQEPWAIALAAILLVGLGLRLWGIRYGLPFGYQIDEERLYVPQAVAMLDHSTFDPHYFQNPPLYTYTLREVFAGAFHGQDIGVRLDTVPDRGAIFFAARLVTALSGTVAVGLVYMAGHRFFDDRRVGLLAAGLMAVAFLPVFYSHVALDNVPAMAIVCGALVGTAGVKRWGRPRDYLVAGLLTGAGAATKYIDGFVLIPLVITILLASTDDLKLRFRRVGLVVSLGALAFVILNPYALIEFSFFRHELELQRSAVKLLKVGQDPDYGIPYYLKTFGWGLGVVPCLFALAGAGLLFRRDRGLFWTLVPIVPAFIVFMGLNSQYYGRWMLPLFPIVCLLAAFAGIEFINAAKHHRPTLASAATAGALVALLGQSAIYAIHNDRVLSRPHTFNLAREWMLANIPRNARIAIEPKHHELWSAPWPRAADYLFSKSGERIIPHLYGPHLGPRLVSTYEAKHVCWVQTSSDYWGPALADNSGITDGAAGYYRALRRHGNVVFSASPYGSVDSPVGPGKDRVSFNYDWAFDFYPLAYTRPGPAIQIFHLNGGACGRGHPDHYRKVPPSEAALDSVLDQHALTGLDRAQGSYW